MHFSQTVLVALAAHTLGAAARPWQQEARYPPALQLGKRYDNLTTTFSMSMGTSASTQSTTSSSSTTSLTSMVSSSSQQSSASTSTQSSTVSSTKSMTSSATSSAASSTASSSSSQQTSASTSTQSVTVSSTQSVTATSSTASSSTSQRASVTTSSLSLTVSSTHSMTSISAATSSTTGSQVSTVSSGSSIASPSVIGSSSSSSTLSVSGSFSSSATMSVSKSVSSSATLSATSSSSSSVAPVIHSSSSAAAISGTSSSSPSSTSASASATASTQSLAVQGGTYTTVGCYIDVANTGFPLIGAIKIADMITASQCLNRCADPANGGPYMYAGVEGTQCFCSNNFASATPQSPGACTSGLKKRNGLEKRAGGSIVIYSFTPSTVSTVSSTSSSASTQILVTNTSMSQQTIAPASSTSSQASSSLSQGQQTTSLVGLQSTITMTSSISSSITATSNTFATQTLSTTNPVTLLSTVQSSQASATQSSLSSSTPSQSGSGQPSAQPAQQSASASKNVPQQGYTVVSGDTLSSVAQAFGIPLSDLEAMNNQISNFNNIQVGQVINVPSSRAFTYTVVAGDTLSSIAQTIGISLSALEALNRQIANPNNIQIGQVVNILSPKVYTYTVVAGDTLSSIAQTFGISLSALEALNSQIPNPDFIQVGQVINVPSPRTFVYSVVAGDTLSSIAQAFGITLSALEASNRQIQNPNLIFPGQIITVPMPTQGRFKRDPLCLTCQNVAKRSSDGVEFVVTSLHPTATTVEVGLASKPIDG